MRDMTGGSAATGQIACAQTKRALPWYVNGSLAAPESERLAQHLLVCTRCAAEHALELRIFAAMQTTGDAPAPTAQSGWEKLEQQLDTAVPVARNHTRVLAMAVAAQGVAIVLLTGLLFVQHQAGRASYRTVSEPQAAGSIRMVLAQARPEAAAALAQGVGASLGSDAVADNVYTLIVERGRSLDAAVDWLRAQPGVLLVEQVGPARSPP
jgi:anti-sigma factor RsiW